MAFEMHLPRKRTPHRLDEMRTMFKALSNDTQLAAKIDMRLPNVHFYAKQLGYKVKCSVADDTHTIVQVTQPEDA